MFTGPRQPIIKQSNYCTVYTHGEKWSLHTPFHKHNDHWFWGDWERPHFTTYMYPLHKLIHVSFYLPGLMQGCTFSSLLSAAWNWPPAAAFVSAGSLDKKTCPYWWPGLCCALPLIPQTAYALQRLAYMHNKVAANTFSPLTHISYSSRWILTCFKWMCRHTHTQDIIKKSEQCGHRDRQYTQMVDLCTLPYPFWNCILTSNRVAAAEHAQTLPLCLKIRTETNKSMQITACALNPNSEGHTVRQKWPCYMFFVLLMDYLCRECLVAPSKTHYSSYHVCAGNMEQEV